ncbi:hypothetical protein [Streptomyces sp. NPDC059003]|uniref:hypothetical protein n=1 Tax=Streptomyces sp. NPDC059003 TaxID=3346691 RepID=UPI0036A003A6
MSTDDAALDRPADVVPGPDALVLERRRLRPGTDQAKLSLLADMRWDLRPGIFEDHMGAVTLNFALVPERFREITKIYIWQELNCEEDPPSLRRANVSGRLAVYSMMGQLRVLRVLLDWLELHGFSEVSQMTSEDLEDFLDAVRDAELTHSNRCDILQCVRRLWAFREQLPASGRLPQAPPWGGKDSRILLGASRRNRENSTARIREATMAMTVLWAARFVEDFAEDVLAALEEFRPLFGFQPGRYSPGPHRRSRTPDHYGATPEAAALIELFRTAGRELPGRQREDGSWEPDWPFLAKLLNLSPRAMQKNQTFRRMFLGSGLRVAHGTFLAVRPKGRLDGEPWVDNIPYAEVRVLARMLSTACAVLVLYLTGCRPGEALSLQRGCLRRDRVTQLWELHGRKWKGARDENGAKIPEGQFRDDPWIATDLVATAVRVQERLHDSDVLFPAWLVVDGRKPRDVGVARTTAKINKDLNNFVTWVNDFCSRHGRTDVIPPDPRRLTSSRLRRTLAWFICRRPRGLVAAAIQYGHLRVQITQGYAGNYASGFPDDLAFERWLTRLDDLQGADRRLKAGEHVSGPAADAYRSRVTGGATKFAGRVLRSGRDARHVLGNPALQIYPGKGMTCVFAAPTARCELEPSLDDAHVTPDTDGCHPACVNLARTEENINELRAEAAELRSKVEDEASPPIRWNRERRRLAHLDHLIAEHERGRPGPGAC